MKKIIYVFLLLFFVSCFKTKKPISRSKLHCIQINDQKVKWGDFTKPVWLSCFGLDAADLNHDGWSFG